MSFRGLFLLVVGSAPAMGAPTNLDLLTELEGNLDRLDDNLEDLSEDFLERRGLIGGAEAKQRYEDAVFAFLLEEYERAAHTFFTLVEADALQNADLRADAEWYLAESLFELGNFNLANQSYEAIVTRGPSHPFFSDAVRRQLELYTIIRDPESFFSVYNRFILTNRVQATDSVQYTLAKSFYRQGDMVRAKSLFGEIGAASSYYGKSRYLLGVVLVAEQNLEAAINAFGVVSELSVENEQDQEIVHLANLALGRLYYETGDLASSSQFYQLIGRDSQYFSDSLYEIVWTFIKQEDYTESLRAVEIFLLAFPEHKSTAQLKVIQGHLHMKLDQYETALNTYERVITEYTPIQNQLLEIAQDPIQPEKWFQRLVELDAEESYETDVVPTYTVEMLIRNPRFHRIRDAVQELDRQEEDVEKAEDLLEEVQAALTNLDHLGNYKRARARLGFLETELLRVQNDLLAAEEGWLLDLADASTLGQIGRLQQQREKLVGGARELTASSETADEQREAYEDQVRAVQSYALRIEQELKTAQAEAAALQRMIDSGETPLSESQLRDANRKLEALRADMEKQAEELKRAQSDSTRSGVVSTMVQGAEPEGQGATMADLSDAYRALRTQYGRLLVSYAGMDREGFIERVKADWSRVDAIQRGTNQIYTTLRAQESKEIAVVREKLAEQEDQVQLVRRDVDTEGSMGDTLAVDITRLGFRELEETFGEKVLEADIGIVDVFWTRKVDVGTDLEGLALEQQSLLNELDARFSNITRGME